MTMFQRIRKIIAQGFIHGTGGHHAISQQQAMDAIVESIEALAKEVDKLKGASTGSNKPS